MNVPTSPPTQKSQYAFPVQNEKIGDFKSIRINLILASLIDLKDFALKEKKWGNSSKEHKDSS